MQNVDEWINDLIEEITSLGIDFAHKDAAARLLEDTKASHLAELKLGFEGVEKSDAGRETRARATDKFQDFLKRLSEARQEAGVAKVLYDAAQRKCDLMRTNEATKRAEMRNVG